MVQSNLHSSLVFLLSKHEESTRHLLVAATPVEVPAGTVGLAKPELAAATMMFAELVLMTPTILEVHSVAVLAAL